MYHKLRKKLTHSLGGDFDRRFWTRFEGETGVPRPRFWTQIKQIKQFNWKIWIPAASAALLALTLFWQPQKPGLELMSGNDNPAQILALEQELMDLDLFLTIENVDMPDEDWEILLGGNDHAG